MMDDDSTSRTRGEFRDKLFDSYRTTHLANRRNEPAEDSGEIDTFLDYYFGQHLPRDRHLPILELGCGHGPFIRYLKNRGHTSVRGVDISQEQVDRAREFGVDEVELQDAATFLQESDQEWAAIIAIDFFEHLEKGDALEVANLAYENLQEGGKLVLRSPNAAGPFGGRLRYGDLTHEFSFTPRSARQFLAAAGFQDVNVFPTPPVPHGIPSFFRYIIWRFFDAIFKIYLAAETGVVRGHITTQNLITIGTVVQEDRTHRSK